jgi:MFS family permease
MSDRKMENEAVQNAPSLPPSLHPSVSPSLKVILAEGFLSRLSFGIISFALPIFAYRRLGLSLTETGVLLSLNLVSEQLFKPLMGWVADHFGLKRAFTAAITIRSIVALLLTIASSAWQVYAIRLLHGFSESLRDPSVSALIAETSEKRSMASSFAWYNTAKQAAGSIGKAAGGVLLAVSFDNYPGVFAVAFALSFLPMFVVVRYLKEPERHPPVRAGVLIDEQSSGNGPKPAILSFAVLGFLIACTAQMISSLFPVLATEYAGLSTAQAGSIYIVSVVVVIVAGPLFGWISDRVSRKLALSVRGIANAFSSFAFYFFPTFGGLTAGSVADAMGKAAFRPAWGSLMARVSSGDRSRRARTMSYLSLGEGLGETLGPLLGGFLWHTWGISAMLGVRVALALAGEIYAVLLARADK